MPGTKKEISKVSKWYFGPLGGTVSACLTHPLDLLKVHVQTELKGRPKAIQLTLNLLRSDGLLGFYSGLTATLLRQLTYSMVRFAIVESVMRKEGMLDSPTSFRTELQIWGLAGFVGGFVSSPAELITVRMQRDVKRPRNERFNFKHVFDGLYRVVKAEGPINLMNGVTMASLRGTLLTVGQFATYPYFKQMLLDTNLFTEGTNTYITASILAGGVGVLITNPIDKVKTRMMNAPLGRKMSVLTYAKGLVPAVMTKTFIITFIRLIPQTILTFLFFEELRSRFGDEPQP